MNDHPTPLPQSLSSHPSIQEIADTAETYRTWFARIAGWMVDRYLANPAYRFLDTKYDVINRCDFPDTDDFRGKNAVFGWIQGRGLESLVYHAKSLPELSKSTRIDEVIASLETRLGALRARNGGRLFFLSRPDGSPVFAGGSPPPPDHASFSDIFGAKGLYAAARYGKDPIATRAAIDYLRWIQSCLADHRFTNGQFTPGKPGNTTAAGSGRSAVRRRQGPFMIYLGALALVAESCEPDDSWAVSCGLDFIERILNHHVALPDTHPELPAYSMWESIDDAGTLCDDDGRIVSDPGHSIEFAGLAAKFLRAVESRNSLDTSATSRIERIRGHLPGILFRNFANGFRKEPEGITKTIDLATGNPVDSNLPWWSLPETMRSAMEIHRFATGESDRARCRAMFAACHNALVGRYAIAPDSQPGALAVPPLWVQTRSADGNTVDVIPSCSDVDPGYHTNMSVLEALGLAENSTR